MEYDMLKSPPDLLAQNKGPSPGQVAFDALQRWVDSRFHCMMGPPAAYFEIPIGEAPETHGLEEGKSQHPFARFVYQTLYWGCKPTYGSVFEVTTALCATMSGALERALAAFDPESKPLLFWRKTPHIEAHQEEQILTLRCRLVVPGYSFKEAVDDGNPVMLEPDLIARVS